MTTITSGPCSWPDVSQLCCADWATFSPTLQTQAMDWAKTILWAATGRQFGLCQLTVRPCGRYCANCPAGYYYDGYGAWVPYVWNGVWKNCWCGQDGAFCSCDPACRVYLPGPVYSIISVSVDGAPLATGSGEYFVLDQQWLIRSNTTACWPMCADQNLQPGSSTAFEVTYLRGIAVPNVLAQATATTACEYARACLGAECRLPNRITSISRQGVTISMVDISEILKNGLTGIMEVDQVIMALNPFGVKGKTRFYTPDVQPPRQVTWP
jgi:hypothetical protein